MKSDQSQRTLTTQSTNQNLRKKTSSLGEPNVKYIKWYVAKYFLKASFIHNTSKNNTVRFIFFVTARCAGFRIFRLVADLSKGKQLRISPSRQSI